MESLRHDGQLRQLGEGLDARYEGHRHASLATLLHEIEILRIVVEELRDGILRSHVLLHLQVLYVHLQVGRLFVFLWIARHAEAERMSGMLHLRSVHEEAAVEVVHLLDEVSRMCMSARCGGVHTVLLGLVATEKQQILYLKKLHVDEFVFDVFGCRSATDNVRNDGYAEWWLRWQPFLDGGAHADAQTAHCRVLDRRIRCDG